MTRTLRAAVCLSLLLVAVCRAEEAGLVAHYTFEEGPGGKVKDWSGQGNEGAITGDVTYVKLDDDKGYALRFGEGQAYVNCGNKPSLDLKDAVTVVLWFRPDTAPAAGTDAGIIGKGISSYALSYVGTGCWWYIGGGGSGVSGGGVRPTASWRHIAATYDGKDSRIYVDGELAGTRALNAPINTGAGAFYLRYPLLYGNDTKLPFTCALDDVRVYSRALSSEELLQHYRKERGWRQGREAATGQMNVTARAYSALPKLRVEVDFAGLQPLPAGAALAVELLDSTGGKAIDRRDTTEFPASDRFVAIFDTGKTPPGNYVVRTAARDKAGKQIGGVSSVQVALPVPRAARPRAVEVAKPLNNLVIELLNVQAPEPGERREYRFTNPRDGWVFISSDAVAEDDGQVWITLDAAHRDSAVVLHEKGRPRVLETMRYLAAGAHTLAVHSKGGAAKSLVVRAVPEMIFAENGYPWSPFLPGMGPYTPEYLEQIGLFRNCNVVLERHAVEPFSRLWKAQGGKVLMHAGTYQIRAETAEGVYDLLTKLDGFARPDRDGIMFDELSGDSELPRFAGLSGGVRKLAGNPQYRGKVLYPYCGGLYASEPATTFSWEIVEAGYKLAEEKYLSEQPTEAEARKCLEDRLTDTVRQYQAVIPNAQEQMIMVLGYMSAPPESLNINPSVDYKVWLDMQFHHLANAPAFRGLYGIQCYHVAYADEEIVRWSARLFRHYCIEGKKEMLSTTPYLLSHVRNPDFAEGTTGWTLSPAEADSMAVRNAPNYSFLQGRYPQTTQGETVLWTRRSAQGPNRFSQEMKGLVPGRLYSLKMFTADYQVFMSEKGTASFKAVDVKPEMSVGISDAEVVPSGSFTNSFASGICGHIAKGFTRDNNLPITYRVLVFRPLKDKATLTISDWAGDKDPGGPIGQELMHNFIEVQPYLEN